MCERGSWDINPDVETIGQVVDASSEVRDVCGEQEVAEVAYKIGVGDYAAVCDETLRYEVGPIFGQAIVVQQAKNIDKESDIKSWFRQNGGI